MNKPLKSRRSFLSGVAVAGAASAVPGMLKAEENGAKMEPLAKSTSPSETARQRLAYQVRLAAANYQKDQPVAAHAVNVDETRSPSGVVSYSKGLMQNALGEPDSLSYRAFVKACETGSMDSFNLVVMGGTSRLANPLGAYAYGLEGADSHQLTMPAPPSCSSAGMAADMVEDYWRALTRDVAFNDYGTAGLIQQASDDMSTLSAYSGVKVNGKVTPNVIFRGQTAGDLQGPILSQFLLKPIPYGGTIIPQTWRTYTPGSDYVTTYGDWLNIQNGIPPTATQQFDTTPRYIRNMRDLAAFVHNDYPYEAFLNAACILQGLGGAVASTTSPYAVGGPTTGFVTFGPVMVFDLVSRVAAAALRAAWFQKWNVHRRIRPEQFAGRVHNHVSGAATYALHADLLQSKALPAVFGKTGNYLLPQAYPEGAPLHPSYPAGHACIAGACATVLKAIYAEKAVLASPVAASSDGLTLNPVTGVSLTVGGELDKLASNVALARDSAGVHYRSDSVQGLLLGEKVAIGILRDYRSTLPEFYPAFQFTGFGGALMAV